MLALFWALYSFSLNSSPAWCVFKFPYLNSRIRVMYSIYFFRASYVRLAHAWVARWLTRWYSFRYPPFWLIDWWLCCGVGLWTIGEWGLMYFGYSIFYYYLWILCFGFWSDWFGLIRCCRFSTDTLIVNFKLCYFGCLNGNCTRIDGLVGRCLAFYNVTRIFSFLFLATPEEASVGKES